MCACSSALQQNAACGKYDIWSCFSTGSNAPTRCSYDFAITLILRKAIDVWQRCNNHVHRTTPLPASEWWEGCLPPQTGFSSFLHSSLYETCQQAINWSWCAHISRHYVHHILHVPITDLSDVHRYIRVSTFLLNSLLMPFTLPGSHNCPTLLRG